MTVQEKNYLLDAYNLVDRFNSSESVREQVLGSFQWGTRRDLFFYINTLLRYSSTYGEGSYVNYYNQSFAREMRLFTKKQLRGNSEFSEKLEFFFNRCKNDTKEFNGLGEIIRTSQAIGGTVYTDDELRRLRQQQLDQLRAQQENSNILAAALVGVKPGKSDPVPIQNETQGADYLAKEEIKQRLEKALVLIEKDKSILIDARKQRELIESGLLTRAELNELSNRFDLLGIKEKRDQELKEIANKIHSERETDGEKKKLETERLEKAKKEEEKEKNPPAAPPPPPPPQTTPTAPQQSASSPAPVRTIRRVRQSITPNQRLRLGIKRLGRDLGVYKLPPKTISATQTTGAPSTIQTLGKVGQALVQNAGPGSKTIVSRLAIQAKKSSEGYRTNLVTGAVMGLITGLRYGPAAGVAGFVAGAAAPEVVKTIFKRGLSPDQSSQPPLPPISSGSGAASGGGFFGGARKAGGFFFGPKKWIILGLLLLISLPFLFSMLNSTSFCPPYQDGCTGGETFSSDSTVKIEKSGPKEVDNGAEIEYIISVTYLGSGSGNIEITDKVPENTEFMSASDGGTLSGSDVKWSLSSVPANQPKRITMKVKSTQDDIWVMNSASWLLRSLTGGGGGIDPSTVVNIGDFETLMRGQGRNISVMGDENSFVSKAVTNAPQFLAGKDEQVRAVYKEAVSLNVNPLAVLVHWGTETGFRMDLTDKAFSCPVRESTSFSAQARCSAKTFDYWMGDFEKNNIDGKHYDKRYPNCVYDDPFLWAAEMYGPTCRVYDSNEHYHTNFVKFYKQILGAT